jgi:hypothetical protein
MDRWGIFSSYPLHVFFAMEWYTGSRFRTGDSIVSGKQSGYLSYLLRLWQDNNGDTLCSRDEAPLDHTEDKAVWRASLESSLTGEKHGFASLDDLFAFLRRQTGVVSTAEDAEDRTS